MNCSDGEDIFVFLASSIPGPRRAYGIPAQVKYSHLTENVYPCLSLELPGLGSVFLGVASKHGAACCEGKLRACVVQARVVLATKS